MLFSTIEFVVFFVVVLAAITIIKNRQFQHLFLLFASFFFFYYSSNYLLILLISSILLNCPNNFFPIPDDEPNKIIIYGHLTNAMPKDNPTPNPINNRFSFFLILF